MEPCQGQPQHPPPLMLPPNVGNALETIANHPRLRHALRAAGAQVGGGNVLAAHWSDHRCSTDIDLMLPAQAFEARFDDLWSALKTIDAKEHRIVRDSDDVAIVLQAKQVNATNSDIEIVHDTLGDQLKRHHVTEPGAVIDGLGLRSEAKTLILAKKFYRMSRQSLERDHYNVLWAAYRDRDTLIQAAIRHTSPELIQTTAMEAQGDPQQLFKNQTKPVLEPKAPGWKTVLAQVWQGIDAFTNDPTKRAWRLPPLEGASLEPGREFER